MLNVFLHGPAIAVLPVPNKNGVRSRYSRGDAVVRCCCLLMATRWSRVWFEPVQATSIHTKHSVVLRIDDAVASRHCDLIAAVTRVEQCKDHATCHAPMRESLRQLVCIARSVPSTHRPRASPRTRAVLRRTSQVPRCIKTRRAPSPRHTRFIHLQAPRDGLVTRISRTWHRLCISLAIGPTWVRRGCNTKYSL